MLYNFFVKIQQGFKQYQTFSFAAQNRVSSAPGDKILENNLGTIICKSHTTCCQLSSVGKPRNVQKNILFGQKI